MKNPATFRRAAGAAGLLLGAPLMAVAMGTDVPFSGDPAEVLAAVDEAGARAWLSAITYAFAQVALMIGLLAVAHLLRGRAPILSNLGGGLSVLGAFGHTVHAGGVLVLVSMAQGGVGAESAATVLDDYQSGPAGLFSAIGLLGSVVGLVLLTVGLWRAGVGPRWVPPTLAVFVLVEFVGSGSSEWASYAAGVLYVTTFVALAVTVRRSPVEEWQTRVDGPDDAARPAPDAAPSRR
jgi:hypothetical protein